MNTTSKSVKPFRQFGSAGLEFDPAAKAIAILDRSGRAVWNKS